MAQCGAVHLRFAQYTGDRVLSEFLTGIGYEQRRPQPELCAPQLAALGYQTSAPCDPWANLGWELNQLATSPSFFDERQTGRRTFIEYPYQLGETGGSTKPFSSAPPSASLASPSADHGRALSHMRNALITPGGAFIKHVIPVAPVLRQVYASRNCTFLTVFLMRAPVEHYISYYFHAETEGLRAFKVLHPTRYVGPPNRSLFVYSRAFRDTQMVQLACVNPQRECKTQRNTPDGEGFTPDSLYAYELPNLHLLRSTLNTFDVIGVPEEPDRLLQELCFRLAGRHACTNTANMRVYGQAVQSHDWETAIDLPVASRAITQTGVPINGTAYEGALTIDQVRRAVQRGTQLYDNILAVAPVTACVHAAVLRTWRSQSVPRGEMVAGYSPFVAAIAAC